MTVLHVRSGWAGHNKPDIFEKTMNPLAEPPRHSGVVTAKLLTIFNNCGVRHWLYNCCNKRRCAEWQQSDDHELPGGGMSQNVHRLIVPRLCNESVEGFMDRAEKAAMMAIAAQEARRAF